MTSASGLPRPAELPGFDLVYSGKVRDLYAPLVDGVRDTTRLLLVASDRVSAYDHVLATPIPDKGAVLTQLSRWWFDRLSDVVGNHLLADQSAVPAQVADRAVLVRRLEMLPVECIARAYLTGGGLAEYERTGTVSGVRLPPGLRDGDRLDTPVFTPSSKAEVGEHDEPITFDQTVALLGGPLAERVRDLTVRILERGNALARERGILIVDTKVEFGLDPDRDPADPEAGIHVVLADEVLTPDSSRFWRAEDWAPGRPGASYDKQVLRDWLTSEASGWDRGGVLPPPELPDDVVRLTRERYVQAHRALTGRDITSPAPA